MSFIACPSVRGWTITRTGKELIVPESFTSQQISFGWPSCCDTNVAEHLLVSCHNSGFVINDPSEWLNQTRGRWTNRRGRDKDQKTPIKTDTSHIQNRRYLPSKISPSRIIRLWEIANILSAHHPLPPPCKLRNSTQPGIYKLKSVIYWNSRDICCNSFVKEHLRRPLTWSVVSRLQEQSYDIGLSR